MIGTLGNIVFEVIGDKVLTFTDLKRKRQIRIAEHEILQQKPLLEYLGPGLDEVTMSIQLNAALGIVPAEQLVKITKLFDAAKAVDLIIGGKPLSNSRWVITGVDDDFAFFDGKGNLLQINVALTLKEYAERAVS